MGEIHSHFDRRIIRCAAAQIKSKVVFADQKQRGGYYRA